MIVGFLCLAVSVFAMLAAHGGADAAETVADLFGVIAFVLVTTGFLKRMFHMIERRLMDIEQSLSHDPTAAQPAELGAQMPIEKKRPWWDF